MYQVGLALSLTCRDFAEKALPLLYQHLLIRNTHASRVLVGNLDKALPTDRSVKPERRGTFVKSIEFVDCHEREERRRRLVDKQYTVDYGRLFESFALHALHLCPNLTSLHFSTAPYPPTKWVFTNPDQGFYFPLVNLPPPSVQPLILENVRELSVHGRSQTTLYDLMASWKFGRLRSISLGANNLVNNKILRAHGTTVTRLHLSTDGDIPLTKLTKLCPDLHVLIISDESKDGIGKKHLANFLMGHNTLSRFVFQTRSCDETMQGWMDNLRKNPCPELPKLKDYYFRKVATASPERIDLQCRKETGLDGERKTRPSERR
ncbi:hypothetical protein SISSUDRAFT_1129555 [Sistotremastrum suecicum HHB10207 ss-3]|uniref:RNI-like protein n=1 Tax=Sistotremastrum suecicum HHB10207 ss-3 TaxID=1314776 RepID=A0A166CJK3_9AGAM|nr:hypothetical protein SISSUDRAFT_1129555 [Sistotremastrum suecicum HHB10207 ss-3]